jgi:phage tail-like protein
MAAAPPKNASTKDRAYSAAHFLLELDGEQTVGFCRSVEGGGVKADILTYRNGGQPGKKAAGAAEMFRQVGRPKYEDLKIQVGMSMSKDFYKWIEAFFRGERQYRNGAIAASDFHFVERARRTFSRALISEVSIPKLDATDRNACYMGVTLVPETLAFEKGSGKEVKPTGGIKQKLWTPNNFEMQIEGFPQEAFSRVTRVDGFTIKQQILSYAYGSSRDALRFPGIIEFPNMSFYVPEADAWPFVEHFTKRVIKGEPPPAARHEGSLTFKDHGGDELITITIRGIELANVAPDKSDSTSKEIKQVKIDFSCEGMKFEYLGAGTG